MRVHHLVFVDHAMFGDHAQVLAKQKSGARCSLHQMFQVSRLDNTTTSEDHKVYHDRCCQLPRFFIIPASPRDGTGNLQAGGPSLKSWGESLVFMEQSIQHFLMTLWQSDLAFRSSNLLSGDCDTA